MQTSRDTTLTTRLWCSRSSFRNTLAPSREHRPFAWAENRLQWQENHGIRDMILILVATKAWFDAAILLCIHSRTYTYIDEDACRRLQPDVKWHVIVHRTTRIILLARQEGEDVGSTRTKIENNDGWRGTSSSSSHHSNVVCQGPTSCGGLSEWPSSTHFRSVSSYCRRFADTFPFLSFHFSSSHLILHTSSSS